MSASIVEPHDKMRARDVNKVAKGEQAPRPPQQSPPVSHPPPPSSTTSKVDRETDGSKKASASDLMRRCYNSYYEYHKCIEEKGTDANDCKKIAEYYKSMCPEWVERWRLN